MPVAAELVSGRVRIDTRHHVSTNPLIPAFLKLYPLEVSWGTGGSSRDRVKAFHLCFLQIIPCLYFFYIGWVSSGLELTKFTAQLRYTKKMQFLCLVYS